MASQIPQRVIAKSNSLTEFDEMVQGITDEELDWFLANNNLSTRRYHVLVQGTDGPEKRKTESTSVMAAAYLKAYARRIGGPGGLGLVSDLSVRTREDRQRLKEALEPIPERPRARGKELSEQDLEAMRQAQEAQDDEEKEDIADEFDKAQQETMGMSGVEQAIHNDQEGQVHVPYHEEETKDEQLVEEAEVVNPEAHATGQTGPEESGEYSETHAGVQGQQPPMSPINVGEVEEKEDVPPPSPIQGPVPPPSPIQTGETDQQAPVPPPSPIQTGETDQAPVPPPSPIDTSFLDFVPPLPPMSPIQTTEPQQPQQTQQPDQPEGGEPTDTTTEQAEPATTAGAQGSRAERSGQKYPNPIHADAIGLFFYSATNPQWDDQLFQDRRQRFRGQQSIPKEPFYQQTKSIIEKFGTELLIMNQKFGLDADLKSILQENHEVLQLYLALRSPHTGTRKQATGGDRTVGVPLRELAEFRAMIAGQPGTGQAQEAAQAPRTDGTPFDIRYKDQEPEAVKKLRGQGVKQEYRKVWKSNPTYLPTQTLDGLRHSISNVEKTEVKTGFDKSLGDPQTVQEPTRKGFGIRVGDDKERENFVSGCNFDSF